MISITRAEEGKWTMLTSNDLLNALELKDIAQLIGKLCPTFDSDCCHAPGCVKSFI